MSGISKWTSRFTRPPASPFLRRQLVTRATGSLRSISPSQFMVLAKSSCTVREARSDLGTRGLVRFSRTSNFCESVSSELLRMVFMSSCSASWLLWNLLMTGVQVVRNWRNSRVSSVRRARPASCLKHSVSALDELLVRACSFPSPCRRPHAASSACRRRRRR